MKTTYYLKENAVGEFLLVAEDDGVVKFVGYFSHSYGVGDLLADLMDGASGQWIDDNNFGNDIEDFSELSENWADCAVIADNDGLYVDRAGKNGKYVIQYARLAHDWESVVDECESEAEIIELFDTFSWTEAFAPLKKDSEKAFEYIIPVMCNLFAVREDDDFVGLVDKISDLGNQLFAVSHARIDYEKTGDDGEFEDCTAAEATRMILTVEGWKSGGQAAETIASALPLDGYVDGPAEYDWDGKYTWHTWKLKK